MNVLLVLSSLWIIYSIFFFQNEFVLLALVLFFTVIGVYISRALSQREDRSFLTKLYIYGFAARLIIALIICYGFTYLFPNDPKLSKGFLTGGDDFRYDEIGSLISESWRQGSNVGIFELPGYFYFNAVIYFLFGHYILAVRIFNSFFGSLVPVFIYSFAKSIDRKIAQTASILTAFIPSQLIYSATQLKDIIIVFIFTFATWAIAKLYKKWNIWLIILVIPPIIYLMYLRPPYMFLLIFVIIIYLARYFTQSPLKVLVISSLMIVILGISLEYLGYGFMGAKYFQIFDSDLRGEFFLLQARQAESRKFYSIFSGVSYTEIHLFPVAMLLAWITPFPLYIFVDTLSFDNWLSFFIASGWYPMIPFIVYGLLCSIKSKDNKIFLLSITIILVLISLCFSGIGIVSGGRHREVVIPHMLILAAWGIKDYRLGKSGIRLVLLLYIAIITMLFFIFTHVKIAPIVPGTICLILLFGIGYLVIRLFRRIPYMGKGKRI